VRGEIDEFAADVKDDRDDGDAAKGTSLAERRLKFPHRMRVRFRRGSNADRLVDKNRSIAMRDGLRWV